MCFANDVRSIISFLADPGVVERWDEVLRASGFQLQSVPGLLSSEGWDACVGCAIDWFGVGDVEGDHFGSCSRLYNMEMCI